MHCEALRSQKGQEKFWLRTLTKVFQTLGMSRDLGACILRACAQWSTASTTTSATSVFMAAKFRQKQLSHSTSTFAAYNQDIRVRFGDERERIDAG